MKAKANGIEMNYELHGKEGAPWLVLSHSLACSVRMWDPQIAALKEIKCPVLVLCGDQDPGTPPAMSEEIQRSAPGSKLVMIKQAAHLSNVEQPERFTKALSGFLAAH